MDTTTSPPLRVHRFLETEPVDLAVVHPSGRAPHLVPTWFIWDGDG